MEPFDFEYEVLTFCEHCYLTMSRKNRQYGDLWKVVGPYVLLVEALGAIFRLVRALLKDPSLIHTPKAIDILKDAHNYIVLTALWARLKPGQHHAQPLAIPKRAIVAETENEILIDLVALGGGTNEPWQPDTAWSAVE
jgi:hypothetical protein